MYPRVVGQHVDTVHAIEDILDQTLDFSTGSDVRANELRPASPLGNRAAYGHTAFFVEVSDHDVSALVGQPFGNRAPNAATGTSHNGNLVGETLEHNVTLLAIFMVDPT